MKDVRITVMRITEYTDLMKEYENPIEHACMMKLNDSFVSKNGDIPENFCESAWGSMEFFVADESVRIMKTLTGRIA